MQLSNTYKILPYSLSCDTLFVSFSQYYQAKHHHCNDVQEFIPIIRQHCQTYKIVILADSLQSGKQLINKIRQKQQLLNSLARVGDIRYQQPILTPQQINCFNQNNSQLTIQPSSLLHLKTLFSKTQNRISALTAGIESRKLKMYKQISINNSQKVKCKQLKTALKNLENLKDSKAILNEQIQKRNYIAEDLDWNLLSAEDDQEDDENQDQYLLSGSIEN